MTSPPAPLLRGYGVHTSREIPPDAWFRPLALGCWIVPGSPSLRLRMRLVESDYFAALVMTIYWVYKA